MIIIELDAGHGGHDRGGNYNGILEKTRNLATAYAVKKLLVKTGKFIVKMTRTDDTFIGLTRRAEISNEDGAHLFVSFHYNMAPKELKAKGYEIYHYPKSPNGIEMATLLSKEFDKMGLSKRFVGSGMMCDSSQGNYTVIHKTKAPAILIEPEFLNNPEIQDWTPEKVAAPIYAAILKYFEIEEPKQYTWKEKGIIELNQVGILKDKDEWLKKREEPMPVWAVTSLLSAMYNKLK